MAQFVGGEEEGGSGFPIQNQAVLLFEANESRSTEVKVDVITQIFADRVVVVVSQTRKLGTMVSAECSTSPEGHKTFEIKTLLGKREDSLLDVYARQIIERIASTSTKPLLLCIALKEEGRDVKIFEGTLNKIIELGGGLW